jgi:hypothetical protein
MVDVVVAVDLETPSAVLAGVGNPCHSHRLETGATQHDRGRGDQAAIGGGGFCDATVLRNFASGIVWSAEARVSSERKKTKKLSADSAVRVS